MRAQQARPRFHNECSESVVGDRHHLRADVGRLALPRAEVAERLGRSVATVRRLEGSKLHPKISARGTRLFDPGEVDALAREVQETGRALSPTDRTVPQEDRPSWEEYDELQEQVDMLRAENRDLATELQDAHSRADAAQSQLSKLRHAVRRWAGDMDQACALLIQADTDQLQELALEALAAVPDEVPS